MSEAAETENPARYALFKALFLRSEGRPQAEVHRLIDAYAHELAEQQRAWIADRTDMPWWADEIADVIDPEKSVGLVRPGEEPTT
jgi:hypothetical protein